MWFAETIESGLAIRRLMFNFMPSWWLRHYGLGWGRHMFFDPDHRVACHQRMRRLMHERFSTMPIGASNPPAEVIAPELNNAVTPALAGCEVHFPEDNYPWSEHLPPEKIRRLTLPDDLATCFPFTEVDKQVAYLNEKLGARAVPRWYVRGVLNDAVLLCGSSLFEDFYADTASVGRVLDYTHALLSFVIAHNHSVGDRSPVMLCNCSVMMVSPELYGQRILAHDRDICDSVAALGLPVALHHCGNFDRYADRYRSIQGFDFIEIGSESDIRLALNTFPESDIQYIVDARFLAGSCRRDVSELMERILDAARGDWHRFRLNVPDIDFGTPDENLIEIFERCTTA